MKNDGRSLFLAQIKCGVRSIVDDLDYLRIKYGLDKIEVLTPKVETRLRSGFLPAIPLRIKIRWDETIYITATYEVGYPNSTPLKLEFEFVKNHQEDSLNFEGLTDLVYEFCNQKIDNQNEEAQYPKSMEVLQFFNESLNSMRTCNSKTNNTNSEDVVNLTNIDSVEGSGQDEHQMNVLNDTEMGEDISNIIPDDTEYKCGICRIVLFHHRDVLITPCQINKTKPTSTSTSTTKCSSYFLESLPDWHYTSNHEGISSSSSSTSSANDNNSLSDRNGGKILCPNTKCKSKLGHWHWAGVQCGCSAWVTPGFQIIKSKVDMNLLVPAPVVPAVGVPVALVEPAVSTLPTTSATMMTVTPPPVVLPTVTTPLQLP